MFQQAIGQHKTTALFACADFSWTMLLAWSLPVENLLWTQKYFVYKHFVFSRHSKMLCYMDRGRKRHHSVLQLEKVKSAFQLVRIHIQSPVCHDTTTHTCTYTRPPCVLPYCAALAGSRGGSVLEGACCVFAAGGLTAWFRPQLFLKFLDYFFQVFPSLPFMHQVSSELLPVGLCVLELDL